MLLFVYWLPFIHPVSTLMLKDMVMFNDYDRRWVPIENMSPILIHSVMIAEDRQFCSHQGIDWQQLNMAVIDVVNGKRIRGASTITMQMVKNLFLWNGRFFIRKMLELPLAFFMDAILPKWRIMEIYLNIAEWGPGIYGVEAAAQHYFGRSAFQLSPRQAAYLVTALPNPILRDPEKLTQTLQKVARVVEIRANQMGPSLDCMQQTRH